MTERTTTAALLDEYVDWYFDTNPIAATALGAQGYDDQLGDFSATGFEARDATRLRWLTRFEELDTGSDLDDGIDRDLVLATLRGEQAVSDWPHWRRDPAAYLAPLFAALYTPFLHRLRPDAQIVQSTAARLRQVSDVLAAMRANLDPDMAAPLLVRRALSQARAGRAFVTGSLPAETADQDLAAQLREAAEPAAEAFDTAVAFLTEFADRASGDWRMGERRYTALLQQRELLDCDAAQLHQRGLQAWAELDAEMTELASQVDPTADDWRTVIDRMSDDYPPTLEAMRAEYDAETQRARKFLVENALVTLPDGELCRVVPSPNFQRPIFAVAFYVAPPPLTVSRLGHFFVPFTPDGYGEEQVRERLRSNSRAQLPTTSVHEAYPGHHWHLSWMADTPRKIRMLFRSSYFAEGWALYTERMMCEQGYFTSPQHRLAHLEARIFRAARIVTDTALHCNDSLGTGYSGRDPAGGNGPSGGSFSGGMTIEQAERFMSTKGTLNPDTATAEVNRYCAWPTQAASYLTGCLEIERIRSQYLADGRGNLRDFHDQLAGSGSLPLGLARRAVLGG